jgi:hypothetical protein
MFENILQQFHEDMQKALTRATQTLQEQIDFGGVEQELAQLLDNLATEVLTGLLNDHLRSPEFLAQAKTTGTQEGLRFKGYREISVYLSTGQRVKVMSPYFLPKQKKRGRKKRGPNGRGRHLGLELLGFIKRGSPNFVSDVVKLAVLCPSFAVTKEVLKDRRIHLNVKTIRRYCRDLGEVGLADRGAISLQAEEALAGQTLVVSVDGGRVRERKPKRGRKKHGQRRQGYTTRWKEPLLFTLYALDDEGKLHTAFTPIHDATMGDYDACFALLRRYLHALPLHSIRRIVFTGDGARWIWPRVETLIEELGIDADRVRQVLDYAHAIENLHKIVKLLPAPKRAQKFRVWKRLVFQGKIDDLGKAIRLALTGKKQEKGLTKWRNYFRKNAIRMQYAQCQKAHLPCGSGHVESAIRRVINLRLKAPGTFWTTAMAEVFLFLRSQLLSGRWQVFLTNATRRLAGSLT